jgi:hypothetical protein
MPEVSRVQRANQALDEEIAALKQQVAASKKRRSPPVRPDEQASEDTSQPSASTAIPSDTSPDTSDAQHTSVDALSLQIDRLQTLQSWVNSDPDLLSPIGKMVGINVTTSFRKNLMWSIVLGVIFLFAGWLLSIVATPSTLSTFFVR